MHIIKITGCLTALLCCSTPALAAGMDDFIGNWVGDGAVENCEETSEGEYHGYLIYKDSLGFGWGGFCEDLKMKIVGDVLTITGVCRAEENAATDIDLTVKKLKNGKVQITDGDMTGLFYRCPLDD